MLYKSSMDGILWPAITDVQASASLAILFQLEQSQWWPPHLLEQHQLSQFGLVLRHAWNTMPFWRERLAAHGCEPRGAVTRDWLARLPILSRSDVQAGGESLLCRNVPPQHGRVVSGETSGSTGRPIHYFGTELTQFFWRTGTLRDHSWHSRDLRGKLAAIRPKMLQAELPGWGPSSDAVFRTGKCVTYPIGTDLDTQLDWLQREAPDYLLSNAYNVYWLARRSIERGIALAGLREARCYGGTFPEDAGETVRRAWGVALTDVYTAEEVGYIALQCPEHRQYHVQSENLIVEILDDRGEPCPPGAIGRVVLTTLHNFAMPLIRYDIGDYAEAGAPCRCGRGLPAMARVLGRQRNILTLPDGRRRWPSFPSSKWSHIAPVRQLQLTQKSPQRILVRFVADRELAQQESEELLGALRHCLGHPFAMEFERVPEIPRSASYKFEDFVSEIAI